MFVDGLDGSIKKLVVRYREQKLKSTYLEVVQFARAEGETVRALRNSSLARNLNST